MSPYVVVPPVITPPEPRVVESVSDELDVSLPQLVIVGEPDTTLL